MCIRDRFLIGILWDGWSNTWLLRILELMAIGFPVAIVIVWAGRHAFACDTQLPPASFHGRRSVACVILLTVSSVVVYTAVTTFILESYPKANWSYVSYDLDVDQNNEIRVLQTTQSSPDWQNRYAARPIDSEEPFQTADIVPAAAAAIFEGHGIRSSPFRKFTYLGGFDEYPTTVYVEIVESDNRLLVYSNGQLKAIITPDGGFRDKRKVTGRFSGISYGGVFVNHYQKTPVHISHGVFVDANGIYQIDIADLSIRQLAKGKFDYINTQLGPCLLYTSPSPRDQRGSRMPSSA